MNAVLKRLLESETISDIGNLLGNPKAIRLALSRTNEVAAIREAILDGSLTDDDLRHFVSSRWSELEKGVRFPYDAVLAALVVALDSIGLEFAKEFVSGLAEVRIRELPTSSRVAQLVVPNMQDAIIDSVRRKDVGEPLRFQTAFVDLTQRIPAASASHFSIMDSMFSGNPKVA